MADLEKVKKGLKCCAESRVIKLSCFRECPYWLEQMFCVNALAHDALEFLKEYEACQKLLEEQQGKIKALEALLDFYHAFVAMKCSEEEGEEEEGSDDAGS